MQMGKKQAQSSYLHQACMRQQMVTTPEASAITDAYGMIKVLVRKQYTGPISVVVNMAFEGNCIAGFWPLEFPRMRLVQPIFGVFNLTSTFEFLAKQTVFIANAIAVGGAGQR